MHSWMGDLSPAINDATSRLSERFSDPSYGTLSKVISVFARLYLLLNSRRKMRVSC